MLDVHNKLRNKIHEWQPLAKALKKHVATGLERFHAAAAFRKTNTDNIDLIVSLYMPVC